MSDKIKLTKEETLNLTFIKHNDIIKIIKDAQYLCDKFYYDKEIATLQPVLPPMSNPIEEVNQLQDTIDFVLNKYGENKWQVSSELSDDAKNKNYYLYNMLFGIRQALHNAKGYALSNSKFKDKYQRWEQEYYKNREERPFFYAKQKLENKIKEDAGWVPMYYNGKLEYEYYTNYNGHYISLDKIEQADDKEALSIKAVKEKIARAY